MKKIVIIGIMMIMTLVGCAKQQPSDEAMEAEKTLTIFFDAVSQKKFNQALGLFTEDKETRESINIYNPDGETEHTDIIENYCEATLTCLPAVIIGTKKISDEEYVFSTQFKKDDGTIFVFGPCCGATEEEMPPRDIFDYTVKKIDGKFKVTTPPIYVP